MTVPPISGRASGCDRVIGAGEAMSTLSIRLPDSIRQRVEVLAREDGVDVDALVATALSQRIAVANAA